MEDVPGHFKVTSKVGTRVSLNWSASGKRLTGQMLDEEHRQFYADYAKNRRQDEPLRSQMCYSELSKKAFLDRNAGCC